MTFLTCVIALCQVALLTLVWRMVRDVEKIRDHSRAARELLETLVHRLPPFPGPGGKSRPGTTIRSALADPSTIYVVWVWRNDNWDLDLASLPPGQEPGLPPPFKGSFSGHRVKTACESKGAE